MATNTQAKSALLIFLFVASLFASLVILMLPQSQASGAASVSIISPTASQTLPVGDVTVTGTASANNTVVIYQDGVPLTSVIADGSGNWSTAISNLAEGGNTLTATAIENSEYAYFGALSGTNTMNRLRLSDGTINPGGAPWPVTTTDGWIVPTGLNSSGQIYFVQAGVSSAVPGLFDINSPADLDPVTSYSANPSINVGVLGADGATFYGVNSALDNVSVVNVATNTQTGTISVGSDPQFGALGTDGRIYVSNSSDSSVSIIDTSTNTVAGTLPIACPTTSIGALAFPRGVTSYMYVSCADDGIILRVSTDDGSTLQTIDISSDQADISGMFVSPDNTTLYTSGKLSGANADQVTVVDLAGGVVEEVIPLTAGTLSAFLSPDGQYMYATTPSGSFNLANIDVVSTATNTVIDNIDTSAVGIAGVPIFGLPTTASTSVTFTLASTAAESDSSTLADTGISKVVLSVVSISAMLAAPMLIVLRRRQIV